MNKDFEEMKNKILKKFNDLTFPIRTVVCDGKKYVGRLASDDDNYREAVSCEEIEEL